jgi:hypothetical protein
MGIPKKYLPSKTDLRRARALHAKRSQKAQDVDEGMFSRPTRSYDVYKIDPSRFDMIGVDTPDHLTKTMIDKELRKFL